MIAEEFGYKDPKQQRVIFDMLYNGMSPQEIEKKLSNFDINVATPGAQKTQDIPGNFVSEAEKLACLKLLRGELDLLTLP